MRQAGWILSLFLVVFILLMAWSPRGLWQFRSIFDHSVPIENEVNVLRAENAYLRAALIAQEESSSRQPEGTVLAHVYSRYPLNFKDELVLDKGSRDNIQMNQAVLAPARQFSEETSMFLIGTISQVYNRRSFVQTVFDHDFRSAVRIGTKKVSGLFVGGVSPRITTIPKEARVLPGDVVLSSSADFPYGLILGRVREVRRSPDNLFQEAELELPYDINNLTVAYVGSDL